MKAHLTRAIIGLALVAGAASATPAAAAPTLSVSLKVVPGKVVNNSPATMSAKTQSGAQCSGVIEAVSGVTPTVVNLARQTAAHGGRISWKFTINTAAPYAVTVVSCTKNGVTAKGEKTFVILQSKPKHT